MNAFAEQLQALAQRSEQHPLQAWLGMEQLVPLCATAHDIVLLAALVTQVAGGRLGLFQDAIACVVRLRQHALVAMVPEAQRSLWRAEGVLVHCDGGNDAVARGHGIASASDACRYDGVLAQIFAYRARFRDAARAMRAAAERAAPLPVDDPAVQQTALIARNVEQLAQDHARGIHALLAAASDAAMASVGRVADWRERHRTLLMRMHAELVRGMPARALRSMQAVMSLEDEEDAGAYERFQTAALACRAYHARGDAQQALRTLDACRDFARRATAHDMSHEVAALERMLGA